TAADTISAITQRDPDWTVLPADVSPAVRALLRRCLQKDRNRRLHHIADARIEIEDALAEDSQTVQQTITPAGVATHRSSWFAKIALGMATGAGIVLGTIYLRPSAETEVRMQVDAITDRGSVAVAFAPNGRAIVFDQTS